MARSLVLRHSLALVLGALLAAPVASAGQEPSPGATLAPAATSVTSPAGAWIVEAFDAWETGLTAPMPDSLLRLSFLDGGQLRGETACGRFDGGWTAEDGEFFAGVAPTGFLGCPDAQTTEAVGLSTALAAVVGWRPDASGGIELLDAAGATRLVLRPLPIGDPAGDWLIGRFRRPNGEWASPVADAPMDLRLGTDGLLTGSTGCRFLFGSYRYDAGDITVGPFETEGLPCEGELAQAERWLLRALGEVTTWEQDGDALVLSSETEPVVELERTLETVE